MIGLRIDGLEIEDADRCESGEDYKVDIKGLQKKEISEDQRVVNCTGIILTHLHPALDSTNAPPITGPRTQPIL